MDDLIKRKDMLRVLDTARKAVEIHPSVVNTVSIEVLNEIRDELLELKEELEELHDWGKSYGVEHALSIINSKIKEYEK